MHKFKFAAGAAAAGLLALAALPASAATVITPVTFSGGLGTILAFKASTANTYDFTFSLVGGQDTLAQIQASTKGPVIQPISFDLYSGTPGGSNSYLGSSSFASGANLEQVLTSGNYFLQLTSIAVNNELVSGSIELTAVPEPATWAMMLVGVGALGAAMRLSRRKDVALAAA